MLYLLFVFINVFACSPTRFPYHMMFVLLDRNTTGANTGAGTVYPFEASECINGKLVGLWIVFYVTFFAHCLSFVCWLSSFHWQILKHLWHHLHTSLALVLFTSVGYCYMCIRNSLWYMKNVHFVEIKTHWQLDSIVYKKKL